MNLHYYVLQYLNNQKQLRKWHVKYCMQKKVFLLSLVVFELRSGVLKRDRAPGPYRPLLGHPGDDDDDDDGTSQPELGVI